MKKILTTLILSVSFFFIAKATHNYGGEITVKQLSYLNYEATIHTYTKASSLPADRDSLEICWGDGICEYIARDTSILLEKDIKHNTYTWQHSYANEGTFTISMTDPNRNYGIINIFTSDNIPFHIQTKIVVSTFFNSTPILLNPPTDWGYINQVYQHNPAAIDWEGDSLVYEIGVPLQGLDDLIPNFSFPDQVPFPNDLDNLHSIDSESGTLTWVTPKLAGDYVLTIKIIEYRNGNIISEVTRDYTIPIKENMNQAPGIVTSIDEVTLSVGDTLVFDVAGSDPENGEILVQALGQPFLLDFPPIFDVPIDFTSGAIATTFEWVIFDNHVYLNPYYVVFRIEEKDAVNCGLTDYHVVKININDSPTNLLIVKQELDAKVFPNPISSNNIFIQLNENIQHEKATVQIISLDGKLMVERRINTSYKTQGFDLQGIPNGNYFLIINSETKTKTFQIGVTQFSK